MPRILKIKSCAIGGEYNGMSGQTPTSYGYISIKPISNVASTYASDSLLAGKVEGIGNGWQKYTLTTSGKVKFTVRGAAGGMNGASGFTINPVTGQVSGIGNRPGRGAKLVGECKLKKNDILYMLVGMRGWCNNAQDWGGGRRRSFCCP